MRERAANGNLRVAVVGCGTIAYWEHLRLLPRLRGVELVAAADPDPEARARVARLTGRPVCERVDDLIARGDVDALVVAAPTHLHADLALAACAARLPFYLEKPIATTIEDGRRIIGAAAAAGVAAVMGFNRRLHPVCEAARALIASGHLGRVRAVHTTLSEPAPAAAMSEWRKHRATGGGALLDLASHHVDLVRWLLGDEVDEVEARAASEVTDLDSAWIRLQMRSGVEVQSYCSFRAGRADWIEILAERGTLRVDRFRPTIELRLARRFGYGVRRVRPWPRVRNAGWRLRRLVHRSYDPSYGRALAAFVAHARGGPRAAPTLEDGVQSLAVVLAAEESARCGRPIRPESG